MNFSPLLAAFVLCSFAVAQPSIDDGGVLNVSSTHSTLTPNVVFVIYGKNIGPASIVTAEAPNYPPVLGGVEVSFTPTAGGGGPLAARLVYVLANAVAGVLPSSAAPGTYAVRVTYNGQVTPPRNVTVVARHFGIAAANGVGSGVAQATINGGLTLTRFTTGAPAGTIFSNAPAHANDTVSLWGTGGGADAANDTGGSSGDQAVAGNFQIVLAGQTIVPSYAAAVAGYPGLWVINFTVPGGAAPTCFATVQVNTNGELSNAVTIPIAAPGQSACTDSVLTQTRLAKLDSGGSIVGGSFTLSKTTSTTTTSLLGQTIVQTSTAESASGGIGSYTAAQYAARFGQRGIPPCIVYDVTGTADSLTVGSPPPAGRNAGTFLPLTGPGLDPAAALTLQNGRYSLPLPTGSLPSGSYTITGTGGPDVGFFNASLSLPSSFTVANWDSISTIGRNQPFTIDWTGGGTESVVIALSVTATISGSVQDPSTQIVRLITVACRADATARTLTIPVSTMALLPAASPDRTTGAFGLLSVAASSNAAASQFNPTLTAGGNLDFGFWLYSLGFSRNVGLN